MNVFRSQICCKSELWEGIVGGRPLEVIWVLFPGGRGHTGYKVPYPRLPPSTPPSTSLQGVSVPWLEAQLVRA